MSEAGVSGDGARSHPAWADLIGWHLAEEVEHRSVTFDAYDQTYGGWLYRTVVGTWAQMHFLRSPRYNPRHVPLSDEVVAMSKLAGIDLQ